MAITNDPTRKALHPLESRFLVLGATGLLGRHVVREFAGRKWPVVAFRRWNTSADGLDLPGVDIAVGELFEPASLKAALAGVNVVIYAIAPSIDQKPREILRKSVEGLRRVLQACRDENVDRVILTSSASTMGRTPPGVRATEDEYYLPGSCNDPFAEAKYAVELEAYRFIADGMDIVMLNPSLLTGPGIDLSPYARLRVRKDQPVNTLDVREAARMHAVAVLRGRSGERYLLGGTNTTADAAFDGWSARGKNPAPPRERYLVEHGQWLESKKARLELGLTS